jgi:hypothetical protein
MDTRSIHRLLAEQYLLRMRMLAANPACYHERTIWTSQARMIARQAARLTVIPQYQPRHARR